MQVLLPAGWPRPKGYANGVAASGRQVLEADYVVGCDGGHSLVRQQIGIERGGTDFDQLMVLAVLRSRELHEGFKRFPPRSTSTWLGMPHFFRHDQQSDPASYSRGMNWIRSGRHCWVCSRCFTPVHWG